MEITSIKVTKFNQEGSRRKGIASIVFDDCFVIKNIRIIERDDRLFAAMPSRRSADGKFHDLAHPLNKETRNWIESAIIEAYNNTEEVTTPVDDDFEEDE